MSGEEMNKDKKEKNQSRSILKTSPNYVKRSLSQEKHAKFDEMNLMHTYHPADRDYGFMQITEPKTPYNFTSSAERDEPSTPLNTSLLLEKLRFAANVRPRNYSIEDGNSTEEETQSLDNPPGAERPTDFERRRKEHYKEYEVVKLAKELIKKDLECDDDENNEPAELPGPSSSPTSNCESEDEKKS